MKKPSALLALSMLGLAAPGLAVSAETPARQVYSIEQMCLKDSPNRSTKLIVAVNATVTSSGWSNPQLSPFIYVRQPDDGVQDYGLVAQPPKGVALTVMSPINAEIPVIAAGWMKGIRVHTDRNTLQLMFDADDHCAK